MRRSACRVYEAARRPVSLTRFLTADRRLVPSRTLSVTSGGVTFALLPSSLDHK